MYERGGFILEKSNGNAYISATKAIIDHLRDWFLGSDRIVSMGVVLKTEKYGVPKDLCFSLPTRCLGGGEYKIIDDLELFEVHQKRIAENRDELLKEKALVESYLAIDS
jgi:malate/lactate dehydrogenase